PAGHAVPVVFPEEAEQDLAEAVRRRGTAHRANAGARPLHRMIVRRYAGHLHGEVDLDRRGQIGGAALEETPAAVLVLSAAQIRDGTTLDTDVDAIEEAMQEKRFGRQGAGSLELADPVTVGRLAR